MDIKTITAILGRMGENPRFQREKLLSFKVIQVEAFDLVFRDDRNTEINIDA
jgi:hypothetical protein